MSLGKGSVVSFSTKQKINTRSSTEAEFVGVDDVVSMVLWVRLFLEAQGCEITDNVVYQDNKSSILLENNGRQSRNVRYLMLFHRTPPWKEFTAAIQRNNLFES